MIQGIGTDLIELKRIEKAMKSVRFIKRILTPDEYSLFAQLKDRRRVEFLAGRFAAKEAYAKALGTGIGKGLSWQDISILNDNKGKPILKATTISDADVHVSLSHTRDLATAFVVIESLSG